MATSEYFEAVKAIEAEHRAAALAVSAMMDRVARDPTLLDPTDVRPTHLHQCFAHLERTYTLRLFSEFEGALRSILARLQSHPPSPRARIYDLMNSFASKLSIPYDALRLAHEVREYRNAMAHPGPAVRVVSLRECGSRLCTFISFTPREV